MFITVFAVSRPRPLVTFCNMLLLFYDELLSAPRPTPIMGDHPFSAVRDCLFNIFAASHSSVGIALGYGVDDRGSRVRFPTGAGNFSLHHRVQKGSGAHPASYSMDTRGSFSGGKAAGA
jgi:hypothetical protein